MANPANPCAEIDVDALPEPMPKVLAGCEPGPIADELAAIPGVAGISVLSTLDQVGRLQVSVSFAGWSPSLHLVQTDARVSCDGGDPTEAEFRLKPLLDRLALRARDAARLGIGAKPLSGFAAGSVTHLHTDRSLVAIHEADPTLPPLVGRLSSACRAVHGGATGYSGEPLLLGILGVVAEITDPARRGHATRLVGGTVWFEEGGVVAPRQNTQAATRFDGVMLFLPHGPFPEAALASLAGRPLSDLVRLHPAIDARTIHRASAQGLTTIVELVPDTVAVADI